MLRLVDAVDIDHCGLEVVGHTTETLGSNEFDVGVVCLALGQLTIDETLCNVEDDAVLKRAVNLQPPRVFPIPHPYALGVPRLELVSGKPPRQVDIVHTAVVERRTFGLVPFAWSQSRCHVADTHDGQFAEFSAVDDASHLVVIPRVEKIHVHGGE